MSASGMFATVPWELVLFDDDPDAKRPTVSAAASRMVLEYLRARAPRDTSTGPLLVGDPDYTTYTKSGEERVRAVYEGATLGRIEHSREEVAAIKALLEDRGANVLLGDQATLGNLRKELFKRVFRNVQVLHLACHGLVNRRAPWLSALALSAATDADDGLLTIDEISRWSFRGLSLVVLAACESGLGTPVPGEGDDGFVRAFHLAGARNVVGSLWKVSDASTKKLMVAFYKYMYEEKLTPAAALQRAKEDLRGDNSTAHPFHWAAWTVWGPGD